MNGNYLLWFTDATLRNTELTSAIPVSTTKMRTSSTVHLCDGGEWTVTYPLRFADVTRRTELTSAKAKLSIPLCTCAGDGSGFNRYRCAGGDFSLFRCADSLDAVHMLHIITLHCIDHTGGPAHKQTGCIGWDCNCVAARRQTHSNSWTRILPQNDLLKSAIRSSIADF